MGWIIDIFKEIPLSVNLQAKLDALEEKFTSLELRNKELESENKNLRQEIQRRNDVIQKEESHNDLLKNAKMKWGCITFAGDNKLYCPSCFHKTGKKIETSRVDVHNRYCAVCKTTVPSG